MRRVVVLAWVCACRAQTPVHHAGEEYLADVRIVGNDTIKTDVLLRGLALHHRESERDVDDYELAVDTTRIAGAYQKRGYFAVDVRSRVDHNGDAATVVFTVVEGPRA
jgi:outer membrane protein assembly factor BamA